MDEGNGLPQLAGMFLGDEALHRDFDAVHVSQVPCPVRISAPHGLDEDMGLLGAPKAEIAEGIAFEDIEHFKERNASRAWWGHADDVKSSIRAPDGLSLHGAVALQVFVPDEPAQALHFLRDQVRRLAGVKARGTLVADALEGSSKVRLGEEVTLRGSLPVPRELLERGGVASKRRERFFNRFLEAPAHPKAFSRQLDRWTHDLLPWEPSQPFMGQVEPGDRAGHANGEHAPVVPSRVVIPFLIQKDIGP